MLALTNHHYSHDDSRISAACHGRAAAVQSSVTQQQHDSGCFCFAERDGWGRMKSCKSHRGRYSQAATKPSIKNPTTVNPIPGQRWFSIFVTHTVTSGKWTPAPVTRTKMCTFILFFQRASVKTCTQQGWVFLNALQPSYMMLGGPRCESSDPFLVHLDLKIKSNE